MREDILGGRYFRKDSQGNVMENRAGLRERVSEAIAATAAQRHLRCTRCRSVGHGPCLQGPHRRHTDIIVKGRRDTEYGHKVFPTGGASTMVLLPFGKAAIFTLETIELVGILNLSVAISRRQQSKMPASSFRQPIRRLNNERTT